MKDYEAFIAKKLTTSPSTGIEDVPELGEYLFPFQQDLVRWALRRGRAAIFADTGLGKSRMQLEWAHHVHQSTQRTVIILAPLAVAAQTKREGERIGIPVTVCRDGSEVQHGINITNYERLHRFDPSIFGAVVLDESSCIKNHDSKSFGLLCEAFEETPFKLCATATPAPNDFTELGTHAAFLGVCSQSEMLAEYFVHDGGDTQTWRLKGHARKQFWRWVSTWAALVRKPSDLGYSNAGYDLPPLEVHRHIVETDKETVKNQGLLFAMEARSLMERRTARRASTGKRVLACVETIRREWLAEKHVHDMEEGVRGKQETSRGIESGVENQEASVVSCERITGSESSENIHAYILQCAPGKIQASNERTARCQQRVETKEVRDGRRISSESKGRSESMAGEESGQAESTENQEVRHNDRAIRRNDGGSELVVRNMPILSHKRQEHLSARRPLPYDGEGSRIAMYELQSSAGEVQGRLCNRSKGGGVSIKPWLIWCDLNAEQDALECAFGDLAFSVRGAQSIDEKEDSILRWLELERPIMISKPSVMGFGLNLQHCANMAFVGVTDSFESHYQAVRRCWRFGQKRPVDVHIFASEAEGSVVENLQRKERESIIMADELSRETRDSVLEQVKGTKRSTIEYSPRTPIKIPSWISAD